MPIVFDCPNARDDKYRNVNQQKVDPKKILEPSDGRDRETDGTVRGAQEKVADRELQHSELVLEASEGCGGPMVELE